MGDFDVLNVFFAYVVCLRHEYDLLGLAFYEELILVMSSRRVGEMPFCYWYLENFLCSANIEDHFEVFAYFLM